MNITIGELRRVIRRAILETGGGTTLPKAPTIRNALAPQMSDREQIGKIAKPRDPDEISPHLIEPIYDEEDTWGPVPPTAPDPYALPDMFSKDTGVLPTPPIKR
jgi:hypothetical protein